MKSKLKKHSVDKSKTIAIRSKKLGNERNVRGCLQSCFETLRNLQCLKTPELLLRVDEDFV